MLPSVLLFIVGWVICAFGQPASSPFLSAIAAAGGYVCIFLVILNLQERKHKFFLGTLWFTLVQAVQFSWLLSHPYAYVYGVYTSVCLLFGLQFGLLCFWITPQRLSYRISLILIPAFWVLLEWSRMYIFSGISWNPVGLSLAGNLYTLQFASLFGVFGMSFWVMFTAVLLLKKYYVRWVIAAAIPFLFGWAHLSYHSSEINKDTPSMQALLVQTAFPIEEMLSFGEKQSLLQFVLDEWKHILTLTSPHLGRPFDLIALPEFVVPFGTYSYVYPYEEVVHLFKSIYGPEHLAYLPEMQPPFGDGKKFVNNAFFVQGIANAFNSSVLIGLEDSEYTEQGHRKIYSAALHFVPNVSPEKWPPADRYEKRVLVPMGEYIPSEYFAELARSYGITGSFTPGQEAKVFQCGNAKISPSICYEETFGSITREGPFNGAEVIVNLTSDAWYPWVTRQHLEHSRLRTVEGGAALARACNTGITCAMDSLGRTIDELGMDNPNAEALAGALPVTIPLYHYSTLYSWLGDWSIIGIILVSLLFLI